MLFCRVLFPPRLFSSLWISFRFSEFVDFIWTVVVSETHLHGFCSQVSFTFSQTSSLLCDRLFSCSGSIKLLQSDILSSYQSRSIISGVKTQIICRLSKSFCLILILSVLTEIMSSVQDDCCCHFQKFGLFQWKCFLPLSNDRAASCNNKSQLNCSFVEILSVLFDLF